MGVNKTQPGSTLNQCNSLSAPTLQPLYTYIHTYIRVHTYVRTYIHSYTNTYIRTYVRTYIHTFIHKYIHTYIQDFLRAIAEFRKATISSFMSVRPSVRMSTWNNSAPARRIFMNMIFEDFSKIYPEKLKFPLNLTRMTGTLHDDVCTFMTSH